ncbi:MAG: hypothetical protein HY423_02900 [Candidatus Lambdaproteobacteria bacterium]|nr:hypothetical protein [Candidatus Lambdaproteobacteria bacterium]
MMALDELVAERLTFENDDDAREAFHARRWSDGLPFVFPTEQRVRAMIAGAGRPAAEPIGVVPPRWAEATVENIAINAVMAGCKPEYMPLLIATLQAACDPAFGLYSVQATTHPCAVTMVVSGPVVARLGLNFSHGAFGPGFRANATLGRAVRLVLINVGGGLPGDGDQSTQGNPGKFSYCIAEHEAATPWEPFRVARGFGKGESTVTVFSGEAPHNINDHVCTSAYSTLSVVADVMGHIGHNNAGSIGRGDVLVVLGPEHAHTIASGGLSRRDVQWFLFEHARNALAKVRIRAQYRQAQWPRWLNPENAEALLPIVEAPEDIHVLVAGGPGKHSAFIPTFGNYRSVSRRVEEVG